MAVVNNHHLSFVSYNMHGFNQGFSTVRDLCIRHSPDLFLLQEHWLLPCNFSSFDKMFPDYFCFGSSAMNSKIDAGILSGRPFGGVAILINKSLQKFTRTIISSDRYCVVKIYNFVIVNVYFPCTGTVDRLLIIDALLNEISCIFADYPDCTVLMGGDMNCDLDCTSDAVNVINSFCSDYGLNRCDVIAKCPFATYVNTALNCSSHVDYFLLSDPFCFASYNVIDEGSNLSDHLPLLLKCTYCINHSAKTHETKSPRQSYLRWDHGDRDAYYSLTGQGLQSLLNAHHDVLFNVNCSRSDAIAQIDFVYDNVVTILHQSAAATIPLRTKGFYKFWWNEELDKLKEESISSHRLWLAAGRPRCGTVASNARACKLRYKSRIRECQQQELNSYTNDLHEALLRKEGTAFWKCWRAKFNTFSNTPTQVDGLTDEKEIVAKFEHHFARCWSPNTVIGSKKLADSFWAGRAGY